MCLKVTLSFVFFVFPYPKFVKVLMASSEGLLLCFWKLCRAIQIQLIHYALTILVVLVTAFDLISIVTSLATKISDELVNVETVKLYIDKVLSVP